MATRTCISLLLSGVAVLLGAVRTPAVDLYKAPIFYETAVADNPVARFEKQLVAGKARLAHEEGRGYLKSFLAAMKVPESSQVFVFSKTSLQRGKISPRTPRALYFNDEVYVGFCLKGDVAEVSVADAALGTAFYTLDQTKAERPRLERQTERCLICHGPRSNQYIPGHIMKSVRTDRAGELINGASSYRTSDSSPFDERWGGWYVTGTHGKMEHAGNRVIRNRGDFDDPETPNDGRNVTDLKAFFPTEPYLTPHSDLVALMVLAHQINVHNALATATLEVRSALHHNPTAAKDRVPLYGGELLRAMLFCDEARLTDEVRGSTDFAREFAARGPGDKRGRSLRDFDLKTRLFKYPCSFLIYTESFDKAPPELRDYVLRRLFDVLTGKDTDKAFAHLTAGDRAAILEILRETKPNLPGYWRE